LSLDKLMTFDFIVPQVEVQHTLASILSAYDDLIENDLHRIEILEEMAQLICREWFVNFRFPGHQNVRMVESPLGKIPERWEVMKLGDVIELAYGRGLKKSQRRPGDVPVFGSSGVVGYHDEALVAGPGIIVGRKGNVGTIHWSDSDFYPIDTVFYAVTDVPLRYVYFNLKTQNFINTDAAVPGLSRSQAYALPFLLPPRLLLDEFQIIIEPIFQAVMLLERTSDILGRTRDLLLPKLISGELDVSELDIKTVEELPHE